MNKVSSVIIIIFATVFAFSQTQVLAQTRERAEVPVNTNRNWKTFTLRTRRGIRPNRSWLLNLMKLPGTKAN